MVFMKENLMASGDKKQIKQIQFFLQTKLDMGHRSRDLAGHESFTAAGRLMVEKNSARGMQAIAFAVIDGNVMREDLGAGIRTAGL